MVVPPGATADLPSVFVTATSTFAPILIVRFVVLLAVLVSISPPTGATVAVFTWSDVAAGSMVPWISTSTVLPGASDKPDQTCVIELYDPTDGLNVGFSSPAGIESTKLIELSVRLPLLVTVTGMV